MKLPIAAELRGIRIKIKKKRLKAEYKIEKKRSKTVEEKDTTSDLHSQLFRHLDKFHGTKTQVGYVQ